MTQPPPMLDYAVAPQSGRALLALRIGVLLVGVALPFLARVPLALLTRGWQWLTDYTALPLEGILFLSLMNLVDWAPVVATCWILRAPTAIVTTAIVGYALPAVLHALIDLRSDAQAAIALMFLPFGALPGVLVGCVLGRMVDRFSAGATARPAPHLLPSSKTTTTEA